MSKPLCLAAACVLAALLVLPARSAPAPGIPDFSGIWWHPSLPGFEPLDSGPTSLRNLTRKNGVSSYDQLVGDYRNPILQPWAAEVVRTFGARSIAGEVYPNPANQCWPEPVPFIYKNFGLQILQHADRITLLYEQDHEVRHVRMNAAHPARVTPSWYGDSVGHYEGDTLVIDTIGQKAGPFAMLDLYGTPYTRALHIVERYRLLDYDAAKDGLDRDEKENFRIPAPMIDRTYRGKHLQIEFTIEDEGVFTTPWKATITFGRGSTLWPEIVCAENPREYTTGKDTDVPRDDTPDF
jgi:hypothetical protein